MAQPLHVIELTIDGKEMKLPLDQASLSIFDSIHSFYNSAKLEIDDKTGYYGELLLFAVGKIITIAYGLPEERLMNKCDYVIIDNNARFTGGNRSIITLSLLNAVFAKQTLLSRAFNIGPVSQIVSSIIGEYSLPLDKVVVEDTEDLKSIWYQTYHTNAKFITETLLPNAFSAGSEFTPFYAYFTSYGGFHFRSLKHMYMAPNTDPEKIQVVGVPTNLSKKVPELSGEESMVRSSEYIPEHSAALDFRRLPYSWKDIYPYMRRKARVFNWQFNKPDVTSLQAPKMGYDVEASLSLVDINKHHRARGVMWDNTDLTRLTQLTTKFNLNGLPEDDSRNKAQLLQELSDKVFIEHYHITMALNPQIHAGSILMVAVQAVEAPAGSSRTVSDLFIVEASEHIWSKEQGVASMTKLTVGRIGISAWSRDLFKSVRDKMYDGMYTYNSIDNLYFKGAPKYGQS